MDIEGTENTMPYLLNAVRAYATPFAALRINSAGRSSNAWAQPTQEIMGVMREVFGVYEEAVEI